MTEEQRSFLEEIIRWNGAATSMELHRVTTRAEDRARQSSKRKGWAIFDRPYWRITEAGRAALAETE